MWKLHRGSVHTAAPLSPAQGGANTHTRIWRHISLFNAGPSVLFFLITCHKWDSFALADKRLLRRWPPNDEAPSLVYGIASSTAATSLWWLMPCTCPVCEDVRVWVWVCLTSRVASTLLWDTWIWASPARHLLCVSHYIKAVELYLTFFIISIYLQGQSCHSGHTTGNNRLEHTACYNLCYPKQIRQF